MNKQWTYFKAQQWASSFLRTAEKDESAAQFVLMMLHEWPLTTLLSHNRDRMPEEECGRYRRAIERIANNEPPQYVVGKAPFFGRRFVVNRDVLIPETETEELVEWVLKELPADRPLRVLDLGTGSGVIGITLALERPRWRVTLSDISAAALKVAVANQRLHGTTLPQVASDLFARLKDARFDLIVTNPPYVALSEVSEMDAAVLEHEPPLALFASEGGLGFYRRLFAEVGDHLAPGGQLFGETGWHQEEGIQQLVNKMAPTATVETRHDLAGRMRMIRATGFVSRNKGENNESNQNFSTR